MRHRPLGFLLFLSLVSAILLSGLCDPCALAAELQIDSETILRVFEREVDGDDEAVVPFYEYFRLDFGALEDKGLSAHVHGWGRVDAADSEFFDDQSQGEILYGYLQYTLDTNNVLARAGRQWVFDGVSNEAVDGARVSSDVGKYFTASVYGGLSVAVEEVDGRDGDWIWGGRISHHYGLFYTIGLSYKRVQNDGDKQEERLGIDSWVRLGRFGTVNGYSTVDLREDEWGEHSYVARIPVYRFVLTPSLEHFDYDAYFNTGEKTASPFVFLQDAKETVTILGGDVSWLVTTTIEVVARVKHYNYDKRDDNAWYYAGLATLRGKGLSQVGGEVGVMDGETDETKYVLWRGYGYWDLAPRFLSGDIVYVDYDEDILKEDSSFFLSLGGGMRFLDDALEVSLSGDYSSDPYFDSDLRGMVNVKYVFDR